MKRYMPLLGVFALVMVTFACQDDTRSPQDMLVPMMEDVGPTLFSSDNTPPDVIPEATVPILDFLSSSVMNVDPEGSIDPALMYAVLPPGGSVLEDKTVYLPAGILPEIADIMFAIDLTGSMWEEIANVKVNSTNIMNQINAAIDDAQFGVISHADYNGTFSGCGYGPAPYGGGADYPYSLDLGLTDVAANVTTAINGLPNLGGADGPESYTRVLYEAYADLGIGWRTDAAKFLLFWQDNVPHDCNYGLDCGPSGSTGPDPGRNNVVDGGGDDLDLATVLAELDDAGVTLVSLHSGGSNSLWDCYAQKTGGNSFQINGDGTIPGGTDIADFVLEKIAEVSQDIDLLELRASAGFEGWVSSDPIYDVDLSVENEFDFGVTFTVPEGTTPDIYTFQVCVYADGAPLDVCQDVQIIVYDPSAGFVTGGGWIDSPVGALNPVDLSMWGDSYYEMVDAYYLDWPTAEAAASAATGAACGYPHLATITSQEEQDALYAIFDGSLQGKWYGGFQTPGVMVPDEGWNWVTGEAWDYTNWAPGEPNDAYGPGSEPHLIGWSDGWAWNDEGNLGSVTGYLIEYDDCYLPVGKANFGFVAKYKKGQSTPDGNTEFQFHAGDLNFHSTSYDWLVVTGADFAMFKGEGTVNGRMCGTGDPYKFMLWAGDNTPDDPDTFRIKIWCELDDGTEAVTYDNGSNQPIGGGSIVVHTK